MKRMMKNWGFGAFCFLTVLFVSGASFQFVSSLIEAYYYPPPGELVDIGGYRLHIHTMGEGYPTVILDAGMGCNSLDWSLVQPKIAKFTKVVSYDRAGNGWSDESPKMRTSDNIVDELHVLLEKSDLRPPFILVGHSFGGINLRLFASRYPDEVLGLVLVDAAHEDQLEKLPPWPHTFLEKMLLNQNFAVISAYLGAVRIVNALQTEFGIEKLPLGIQPIYLAHLCTPKFVRSVNQEFYHLQKSFNLVKEEAPRLKDKPLYVITAGKVLEDKVAVYSKEFIEDAAKVWQELQKDLVTKSTKGVQIIAEQSGHMVSHDQPGLIVQTVKQLVEEIRKN